MKSKISNLNESEDDSAISKVQWWRNLCGGDGQN